MASNKDLNRSIKITIDGTDAAKAVDKLEKEISDLTAQLKSLNKSEADYEKRSKELSDRLGKKNKSLETYKKKVAETDRVLNNLSGATYKELLAVKSQLQKSLQNEVRGTEKYNETLKQYKRVTEEATKAQKDMRAEVGCQGTTFGKVANFLNKYATLITSTLAGITGLSVAMRKSVDDYAKMQEAMAGVKKYTGLADEEIKNLNEDLKKMDTRTSREKLNALAGDAGRLGIQSKEAILEFVDAADKINVALGEDLGEDAVKNIGKLAQMFGEDERLGLRGAMLATGSAINEVAQNSAAAEPFLVNFAARVAGAANQAGISQDKIFGFAAAMDENMLREETSATAYQKILLKLFTDTEKFAESAGLNVQEFAALVRTDANEALLQFAEALGQKGGLVDLAPIFGDLQTEGAGVSTVLSVMAGKADEIRERQALANKAYTEGTSIIKEFNVQNNTVQAGLDKAKKGFHEVSIALGEKLQPLMKHLISGTGLVVRGLNALIDVVVDYHTEIITGSLALVAYTAYLNYNVLATKASTLATNAATIATKLFNKALKLGPWGLVATAAGVFLGVLMRIRKEQNAITESAKSMKRIEEEAGQEFVNQANRVRVLSKMINNENIELEKRKGYLEELKEIMPEYNGMISEEGELIGHNKEEIEEYLKVLEKKIKTKAAEKELEELYTRQREKQKQLEREEEQEKKAKVNLATAEFVANNRASRASTGGTRSLMGGLDQSVQTATNEYNKATKAVEKTKNELVNIGQAIADVNREIASSSAIVIETVIENEPKKPTPSPSGGEESTGKGESPTEKALREEREIHARHLLELKRTYEMQHDDELKTEEQYAQAVEEMEMAHLQRMLEIAGLDADKRMEIENKILDFKIKCMNEAKNAQVKQSKQEEANEKKRMAAIEKATKEKFDTMRGYGEQFGAAIGNVISGQEDAMVALGDMMIDMVFDVLDRLVDAWITELIAKSIKETASAQMTEIGSKGVFGLASGAAMAATIAGLLAAAKAGLKGIIKGKRSSSSASGSSSSSYGNSQRTPTATVAVRQWASGRYDVLGADDGRMYRGVPYIGAAPTGIVRSPALISERGSELIINSEDLALLQQHVNYPLVLSAIQDARRGQVPQRADGNYTSIGMAASPVSPADNRELTDAIRQLVTILPNIRSYVVLRDLDEAREKDNRIKKPFTRS